MPFIEDSCLCRRTFSTAEGRFKLIDLFSLCFGLLKYLTLVRLCGSLRGPKPFDRLVGHLGAHRTHTHT